MNRLWLAVLLIFNFSFIHCIHGREAFGQKTIRVGEVTAQPGEMKSGFINVPAGSDGPAVAVPVTVISGGKAGPVLALTAGIHGYEYAPILALQKLRKQLNPRDLSGIVIMVHVVNIPSYLKRTVYYNPHDWKNMNRAFPGREDGSMCERIAYQISSQVIDRCDYLLDLHCGDGNEDLTPYLYYTVTGDEELDRKSRALATAFGFRMIINETVTPATDSATWCANSALLKGKPALTVESGRLGRTDLEDIERIVQGVDNSLKHLRIITGKPELLSEPVWVKAVTYVRSEHEGIYHPLGRAGDHVQKGELLGYLTDYFGVVLQKAVAPHDGVIMYIIATPPMSKGEPMVKIGRF